MPGIKFAKNYIMPLTSELLGVVPNDIHYNQSTINNIFHKIKQKQTRPPQHMADVQMILKLLIP